VPKRVRKTAVAPVPPVPESVARPGARPTMTDIAKRVGVSQSTVSLVLNHMSGAKLSKATRDNVLQVARELGYQSTRRASAPVPAAADARNVIVYMSDEISTSPHPAVTIDGAREAAWEHDCLVAVHTTRGDAELEQATLQSALRNPSVLGVVYATIFTRAVEPHPLLLDRRAPPTVLLNCYDAARRLSSVIPGEVGGGFVATEYLIAHGHTRIGFINGEPWMDAAKDRLRGYRQALATADLPFDAKLLRDGDWMSSSGFEQAMALLALERPPSAIFCANDLMALGALEAARQRKLAVPRDLSVLGYDDQEIARHAHPALSTVLLPNFAMGRWAVERLIEEATPGMASAEPRPRRQVKMDCPLVERDSVAPRRPLSPSGKARVY
jgi:LacI family transcriptional regulator